MRRFPIPAGFLKAAAACVAMAAGFSFAAPVAPPPPGVPPAIPDPSGNDKSGSRIDDRLEAQIGALRTKATRAASPAEQAAALDELAEPVRVQLIFDQPITQKHIDDFVALGGEIQHVYTAVSYGWNGEIALSRVEQLPAAMGGSLVLVQAPVEVELHLLDATRTGRVRDVWPTDFVSGFGPIQGQSSTTIGVIDTGVDSDHADLVSRLAYWEDFSDDNSATPVDVVGHGTHVTGIAAGSGVGSGSGATFDLNYTVASTYTGDTPENAFAPQPIHLSAGVLYDVSYQFIWNGGGATDLGLVIAPEGTTSFSPINMNFDQTSPFNFLGGTFTPPDPWIFTPFILQNDSNTVGSFAGTVQFTGFPGVGDGFNNLSGVAPNVRYAGAKAFLNTGAGNSDWLDASIDGLVALRETHNIQIINMSLGIIGTPGLSVSTRTKTNNAVSNGIVTVVSAGNSGTAGTVGGREIGDPGRAALAITVGSANRINEVTNYTSHGFSSPGADEDFKPDLLAPGGSDFYALILAADTNDADGPLADQQADDYSPKKGTSMAAPFVAGAAALVIDAMTQAGMTWDFSSSDSALFVKNILLATTTETNANREVGTGFDPTLERNAAGPGGYPAGKDPYEGFGMINNDAAVEAILNEVTPTDTILVALGGDRLARRAWAGRFTLNEGDEVDATLSVPTGADFDLYLYSFTPDAKGNPVVLASSTDPGDGVDEVINHVASAAEDVFFVAKLIDGSGTFDLAFDITPAQQDPETWIVTNLTDRLDTTLTTFDDLTLREAIWFSMSNDVIVYDLDLFIPGPQTTSLDLGVLYVDKALTITGPGADLLTLDGLDDDRVFHLVIGPTTIEGFTIANGFAEPPFQGQFKKLQKTAGSETVWRTSTETRQFEEFFYGGGGILITAVDPVEIKFCHVVDCFAPNGGGISIESNSELIGKQSLLPQVTVSNSAITSNIASGGIESSGDGYGGGIFLLDGQLNLINTTVSTNSAEAGGGGIFVVFGDLFSTYSTITRNTSRALGMEMSFDEAGGGIGMFDGRALLTNTIVAQNVDNPTAGTGDPTWPDLFRFQFTVTEFKQLDSGYNTGLGNVIGINNGVQDVFPESDGGDDIVGTETFPVDPRLGPLAMYGGPTPSHGLLLESPALGLANDIGGIDIDQRTAPRPFMSAFDSGAYQGIDFDGDGILDIEENTVPSHPSSPLQPVTDGEGNGIPDSNQKHVVSLQHAGPAPGKYVTYATPEGLVFRNVQANPLPPGIPSEFLIDPNDFPTGFISFDLDLENPGDSVEIEVIYEQTFSQPLQFVKYGVRPFDPGEKLYTFVSPARGIPGALIPSPPFNTISLIFFDGDVGDHDVTVNGTISDPGGLGELEPLFVTLVSFTATAEDYGDPVTLSWETSAEVSNVGFNLYRAVPLGDDKYAVGERLNEELVPSEATEISGAIYTFTDEVVLEDGEERSYWLEDVDSSGIVTFHGPAHLEVGKETSVSEWMLIH